MDALVIVGAGECGARAAFALREAGHAGPVTLIGSEAHPPYERPPLSKPAEDGGVTCRPVAAPERYREAGIDFRPSVSAVAINRAARRVSLSDGGEVAYARLLLATGSVPRRLPGGSGSHVLRTLDDARAIAAAADGAARVAIVGAGLIGLELAALFRERGLDVTVLEAAPRALGRAVPSEIAEALVARHRAAGVDLRFASQIEKITADGVTLASGDAIPADVVVEAVGVTPETSLARAAGLAVENGVAVDATLATSDAAIFAAGDCCAFPYAVSGTRVRVESWRNAQDQGDHAAHAMLGASEPFRRVPWFWSDQYNLGLQVAGLYDPARPTILRDPGDGSVLCFQRAADGRLTMAAGLGQGTSVARDIRLGEKLIEQGAAIEPAALRDPGVKLKSLLAR